MGIIDKTTKATEHKLIDNLIAIWKKVKPSKTYWRIAIPTGLFILSQVKSWKWAEVVASYAQKQIEGSSCPFCWEVLSALATELTDTARWELVGVGFALLIIITYAFGKESNAKEHKEVLEKAIDNTTQNNYFVTELNRKNQEIDGLKEQLTQASENEQLKLSYEIEELIVEKEQWEVKAKTLQERLSESNMEVVEKVREILDNQGIDEALVYLESIDFDQHEKQSQEYAKALLIKADLYDMNNEHQKAKETYLKSIKFHRTFSNSLDFVNYLSRQNSDIEALKELKIMELELELSENEKIVILGSLANRYSKQNELTKAEWAYNEVLALRRALAETNSSVYKPDVAMTLNNLGVLYSNRNELIKAEEAYNEALELYRVLAETNPSAYKPDIAMTLNNLANLYRARNEQTKAEEVYSEALVLYRALAENNPSAYKSYVARTLNNLAVLYSDRNELTRAEEAYNESLELRKALAETNPSAYKPDIAMTLNNLANLYSDRNEQIKAEKAYIETLELYRVLAETNSSAYKPYVALTLNNLALLYSDRNELTKAKKAYNEALELYRALAQKNFMAYGIELARSIIIGVYSVGFSKENLDESEKILKEFDGVYMAEQLLRFIEQIRNGK